MLKNVFLNQQHSKTRFGKTWVHIYFYINTNNEQLAIVFSEESIVFQFQAQFLL